jgi:hypothetical protein
MEPMDRQATYYVAGQIAGWQDDAWRLPLPDVRAILIDRQDDLSAALEIFDQARHAAGEDGDDGHTEALSWAMTAIFKHATAAAIFAQALTERTVAAAHQN